MAFRSADESYEAFFRAHVDEFAQFLTVVLGSAADVRGGRAGVADALQEAMLRILREWGDLEAAEEPERARRLYRCLRDAAGEALRREHGRRGARTQRPRVLAYDFGALEAEVEELEPRERELTVAVLGAMVRDLAEEAPQAERRAMLERGVLLAGLRALSEREALAMIAVDRLGWDQRQLAEHLGIEFAKLRETLFVARKLFYGVVRHAVGVDIDDTERARLHAYASGDLVGRERRLTRRHIQHCRSCQALLREQRLFTHGAQQLLAPLPFVTAAHVLAKPTTVKAAAGAGAPVGVGLLGQPGAAKALAATLAVLGSGVAVGAGLSIRAGDGAAPSAHVNAPAAAARPSGTLIGLGSSPTGASKGESRGRRAKASSEARRSHTSSASRRRSRTDGRSKTTPSSNAAKTSSPVDASATAGAARAPISTRAAGSSAPAGGEFSFEGH